MPDLEHEVFYRTARSGGSGGQHVNKVETMAEAWWQVSATRCFDADTRERIEDKLKNRINKEGYLIVRCSETRSQLENKTLALQKLRDLVALAIHKPRPRKPTKISRAVKERRLESKRLESAKKQMRRRDW